ncbi:hypothetical protein HPP92_025438 [Vanilla planifolia]|uniref:Uncharacterized protein n=1 Tax=Vanilla planifolia TaxID=51239 RepID=A0A835U901_VANPL|nr:hypothetical protein HPP92_025737 [Vanilla planifolia]KAG0454134.1 hypothetical protein HPP92_025438 [Vanilla planifolia]
MLHAQWAAPLPSASTGCSEPHGCWEDLTARLCPFSQSDPSSGSRRLQCPCLRRVSGPARFYRSMWAATANFLIGFQIRGPISGGSSRGFSGESYRPSGLVNPDSDSLLHFIRRQAWYPTKFGRTRAPVGGWANVATACSSITNHFMSRF